MSSYFSNNNNNNNNSEGPSRINHDNRFEESSLDPNELAELLKSILLSLKTALETCSTTTTTTPKETKLIKFLYLKEVMMIL